MTAPAERPRALRALALVAVLALALAALAAGLALRAISPADPAAGATLFTVPIGATLSRVATDLEGAGLVRSAWAVRLLGRWRGVERRLHAGEYELSAAMPVEEILARIAEGRVRPLELAVPEGWTAADVARRLGDLGLADREAFLALARDAATAAELGVEGPGLEGYLFPETYYLPRGLPEREIARILVAEFLDAWRPLEEEAKAQGLSMREVVTLASIVEKETAATSERPMIAAVFRNRLRLGMRLDSDPTVIYGIAGFDGNLRRVDLENERNPYNTYRIVGLPPGPIANPGADALRAVVRPAQADYLYFVSRNDGTHEFTRSLREHERAVTRWQRSPAGRGGRGER
jgi:UPF0755 protein